ncbi:hypothetical protein [Halococcus salsus]|uniref:hypothetical protein n=1 Tax=Halococcus salsus TaxID=2162894 RepID=UPI001F04C180|nr:hypothetical protein [Halococcus salsus]
MRERDESEGTDQVVSRHPTRRREYLKLASTAAVSAVGLAATSGQASAATTVGGVRFGNTVNMVNEAGCNPNGRGSCHDEVMEYADDDTLLVFPEGTYRLDTGPNTRIDLQGYDKFGMIGKGGGATFEFTSNTDGYKDINVDDVGQFVHRNIDWDITANNCAPGFAVRARDRLFIKDWNVNGRQDKDGGFTLQPGIANPDGVGIIRQFDARDGCEIGSVERNGVLVASGRNNGTLRFIDCHLEEFSNNGIYAAASGGPIQVEGGTFRNSEPSQLRFSGEGSYVDGATVELDISKMPREYGEQIENARGIWWETKNTTPLRSGGEIRNTDVMMRNAGPPPLEETSPNSSAGILIPSGGVTIRDSTVRVDITPRPAIHAQGPLQSNLPEPYRVVMDNVTVEGSANDWAAVQIEERPGSVIRGCEFDIGYRNGVVLAECDGSTVKNTTINSRYGGGRPIVLWGTEASIDNVSTNSSNPLPSGGDGDEIYGPSPINNDSDSDENQKNMVSIEGNGDFSYHLSVSDNLEKSTANGGSINDDDIVSGSTVTGNGIEDGVDSYTFSGGLESFSLTGTATVTLNGKQVDPDEYPNNVVSIVGNGDFEYMLATSADLEKSTANSGSINDGDTISGSTAIGDGIENGVDSYVFSGELEAFQIHGDAIVMLNGETIDPDEYPSNVISIIGNGDFDYRLSVNGAIAKSTANGGSINDEDTISGSTATGNGIKNGVDSYVYFGDLEALNINGAATVMRNGRQRNDR